MMGGGSRGAYEAGVLKAMAELLDPIDYAYDVVQGVSIGSVNAAMYAVNEWGDEKRTIKWMENVWADCEASDSWQFWPLNIVEALWRPGLFDNTPFRDRIH
jgi:NTE family protein